MERLTQTSDRGGVALTFDLDITCEPSEILGFYQERKLKPN